MAHFTIHLPDNLELDIRCSYVYKKTLFGFFRKSMLDNPARKGYLITNKSNQKQYRFLKTFEGKWIDKNEAGFEAGTDETSILIKKEIDEFEKTLNLNERQLF